MSLFTLQKVVFGLCILFLLDCHELNGEALTEDGFMPTTDIDLSFTNGSGGLNLLKRDQDVLSFDIDDGKSWNYHREMEFTSNHDDVRVEGCFGIRKANDWIVFDSEDYESVKKQAQEEQKLILVNFVMASCIRCTELEEAISGSLDLKNLVDEHFIRYDVDIKSKKHPLVKEWRIKSAPMLAVVSPWGHVLNMYNSSSNSEAVANVLNISVEDIDLDRMFLMMDSIKTVGGNARKRVDVELLKISFGSSAVNQLFLYQDVLGPKRQWNARANKELIFNLLPEVDDKSLQLYFLNHLTEFRNMYPKDEVNEKVYEIAFLDEYRASNLRFIFEFLERNIFDDVQYYLIKSEIDFYSFVLPDPLARFNAQLDLYSEFQYDEWSEFRPIFYEMILTAETQEDFYYLEQIALKYEPYAVDYEWLDLYCLLLYKSGLEEDALELINEIKAKALAKGINYRPAIYGLQKK